MKTEEALTVQHREIQERSSVLLMPVMDIQTAMARLAEFQVFCSSYLQESKDGGTDGGDYGIIPGTKKKTLLKSGADKLCEVYGLYDEYEVMSNVEDWNTGLFDYTLKCLLKSRRDDSIVGTGVGSCSSFESKYRWREASKKCPACGSEAIIKGKAEYGGGWLCWNKKGGCGAKFGDGDQKIEGQQTGRVENPDIIDSKNTILKMAKKRAKIDATIGVTRSSGIFTQDMEDIATPPPAPKEAPKAEAPKAADPIASAFEMSTPDQQQKFAVVFREALPPKFQAHAEQLRKAALAEEGYCDEDGVGSSKSIPKRDFQRIANKLIKAAREMKEPFISSDGDLPDNI